MKKSSTRLGVIFAALVFFVIGLSSFFVFSVLNLIGRWPMFNWVHNPFMPSIIQFIISFWAGAGLFVLVGHNIFVPVEHFSEAFQQVAKGDFSVRLPYRYHLREIRQMADNFNLMVQELGSIETLRNDFVNNVSHEFKTPLAAIEGYATLLQDEAITPEESREYTKIIIDSARQLSTLSSNILLISRLENQEIVAQKERFQLDEQIRQVLLILEKFWSEKEQELEIDMEDVLYYGNAGLLTQVWINLIHNAIKFTPKGGTIGIRLNKGPRWITCSISDDGIGMSEEVRRHIFEKFYQADTGRTGQGNGLGLTLVNRIVQLCGGYILVESIPGRGSCFTVKLPVEPEPPAPERRPT